MASRALVLLSALRNTRTPCCLTWRLPAGSHICPARSFHETSGIITSGTTHDESQTEELVQPEEYFHNVREDKQMRYDGHIPTTCFQKGLLAVGSATMAITAPWRDDMIAVMGEVTGYQALRYMQRRMKEDSVGRQILEDQPRINSRMVDLEYLRTLPEGTLGREYITYLDDNRCHPDARLQVQFVDDPDLAVVMQRYREVHDMFHVLLGMPTHMLGEVVVKWVEGIQLRLPLGLLGGFFGAVRLRPKQRQLYMESHLWWAIRVGRNARFLMNIYYEKHWQDKLSDLRAEVGIEEPPKTPRKRWTTP